MTDLQIVYVVVFAVMSIVGFLSMYVDKTTVSYTHLTLPTKLLV